MELAGSPNANESKTTHSFCGARTIFAAGCVALVYEYPFAKLAIYNMLLLTELSTRIIIFVYGRACAIATSWICTKNLAALPRESNTTLDIFLADACVDPHYGAWCLTKPNFQSFQPGQGPAAKIAISYELCAVLWVICLTTHLT